MTQITDSDREAAADIWRDYVARVGEIIVEKQMRQGGLDYGLPTRLAEHRIQSTAAMAAEIERLKASKAHILEDAKQAREAVRQLREDDKTLIDQLRREKAEGIELLESIVAMQSLRYGDATATHLALSSMCQTARALLSRQMEN